MNETNVVTVRWFDGYLERFEATEVRFGSDLLWMRLADGKNRHIPLRQVRWFGMSKESHEGARGDGTLDAVKLKDPRYVCPHGYYYESAEKELGCPDCGK